MLSMFNEAQDLLTRQFGQLVTPEEAIRELERVGALIQNSHIVYVKGGHGDKYVDLAKVTGPYTASRICVPIAYHFRHYQIDLVVAPVQKAPKFAEWVAYYLTLATMPFTGKEVNNIWAEKLPGGGFGFRSSHEPLVRGAKVLVVEDTINSGGTSQDTVAASRRSGAEVVAVAGIWNRGGVTAEKLGVPKLYSLIDLQMDNYPAANCPLCAEGRPINTAVGHGLDFLKNQAEKIAQPVA